MDCKLVGKVYLYIESVTFHKPLLFDVADKVNTLSTLREQSAKNGWYRANDHLPIYMGLWKCNPPNPNRYESESKESPHDLGGPIDIDGMVNHDYNTTVWCVSNLMKIHYHSLVFITKSVFS